MARNLLKQIDAPHVVIAMLTTHAAAGLLGVAPGTNLNFCVLSAHLLDRFAQQRLLAFAALRAQSHRLFE